MVKVYYMKSFMNTLSECMRGYVVIAVINE